MKHPLILAFAIGTLMAGCALETAPVAVSSEAGLLVATIDRTGRPLACQLDRSTGDHAVDKKALAFCEQTQFPAVPEKFEPGQDRFEVRVPVNVERPASRDQSQSAGTR